MEVQPLHTSTMLVAVASEVVASAEALEEAPSVVAVELVEGV
jgi:hypothetical protein